MSKLANLVFKDGKYAAVFDGSVLVKSSSKKYVEDAILSGRSPKARELGVVGFTTSEVKSQVIETPVIQFSMPEKFEFIESLVNMVISKSSNAIIISGGPGLGKTHTVTAMLEAAGKKNSDDCDIDWEVDTDSGEVFAKELPGDYVVIKGFSTAKGLYRLLFEAKDKIVVCDDVDVDKDATAANILKACLDSYDRRFVSWNADMKESDGLPRKFEFTGQVILITNRPQAKIDGAIRSRCLCVDLTSSNTERLEHLKKVVMQDNFMGQFDSTIKTDAIGFLSKNADKAKDMNLRTLQNVIKIRANAGNQWERMSLFFITA
jgi:hypothetical protein